MENNADEFMKSLLNQMEDSNKDRYMNLCYTIIMMFPDKVFDYRETVKESRVASIDKIIFHFEEKEDFEKCAKLKKILDRLKQS
tara:strand:- start:278 stop:529 length:252 start_codon:yes stop_codon:yes gene_type:complete